MNCVVRGVFFFTFKVFKMLSRIYDNCQFFGCPSKRSKDAPLFSFPTKNKERLEIWIKSSGKCQLS